MIREERDRIAVTLLPAHKVALRLLAARRGESMAAVMRDLLRSEAERHGVWQPPGRSEGKEVPHV